MELQLGAQVRNQEGHILGVVHRIVYQPQTQAVSALVVLESLPEDREILVPVESIVAADDEAVEISLPEAAYAGLDIYQEQRNIAPPPDASEVGSDLVHEPVDVPDVPPIGAATGIESIAFTPIVEELTYLAPGEVVIDHSTAVWAVDEEIGKVTSVLVDEVSYTVTAYRTRRGVLFTHSDEIPVDWVENVLPETIVLRVNRSQVETQEHV